MTTFSGSAKVWIYPSDVASWHFLTLPKTMGTTIRARFAGLRRGFGSLPVAVTIGETTFETSIFPDKTSGSYLLPLKAKVRKAEDIWAGDTIRFTLMIRW